MRANAILRAALLSSAALCLSLSASALVFAQDVGVDVGGGAGIFRAKNPETKKSCNQTRNSKPTGHATGNHTRQRRRQLRSVSKTCSKKAMRLATRESLLKPKSLTKKF